jgi:pyruvate dehydrogenase E1 component beta subunit
MYAEAINEGLREEMKRDNSIVILGEEVGTYGGTYKVTQGLMKEFGANRVLDTPISEAAIVGTAVGAAVMGLRPVAELMFFDFTSIALDQIMTHAAKMRFMSGGQVKVPMVVRTQYSLGRGYGCQHSQFYPSIFLQSPGVKVVLPATPKDAKGLIKSALRQDDPVVFIESGLLYFTAKGEVMGPDYLTPIGKADVKRSGKDITIVAISRTVYEALKAAEELEHEGINVEVLDMMTVQPMDYDTLEKSVQKTGRLLVAEDSVKTGGLSSEISAHVAESMIDYLQAPIARVNSPPMPVPFAKELERAYMVSGSKIAEAARSLMKA